MSDETIKISSRTWNRTVDSINKLGYSDGVIDGQTESFQSSFDVGYKQGLEFGFHLGFTDASKKYTQETKENEFLDPRRINCQICSNSNSSNENVVNLYNRQLEKNNNHFPVQFRSDLVVLK